MIKEIFISKPMEDKIKQHKYGVIEAIRKGLNLLFYLKEKQGDGYTITLERDNHKIEIDLEDK